MFRTHATVRANKANNCWFVFHLFGNLFVDSPTNNSSRPLPLQSIRTISESGHLKNIDNPNVSANIKEFAGHLQCAFIPEFPVLGNRLEVFSNRFDLTKIVEK
jgi:hypothetical protein